MTILTLTFIDRYEDLVVQDNFRFGDDKEIVRPALSQISIPFF